MPKKKSPELEQQDYKGRVRRGEQPETVYSLPKEQLQREFREFVESVAAQGGLKVPIEQAVKRASMLEPYVKAAPPAKRDRVAMWIRELEYEAEKFRKEGNRLLTRARRLDTLVKYAKLDIKRVMEDNDIVTAEGELFTFALKNNPPKVEIVVPGLIPDEYWVKQEPVIDKRKLLEELKDGKKVPGAKLEKSKRLEIE